MEGLKMRLLGEQIFEGLQSENQQILRLENQFYFIQVKLVMKKINAPQRKSQRGLLSKNLH